MKKRITLEKRVELEAKAQEFDGKNIALFSDRELVQRAQDNHICLNGFSSINPSDESSHKSAAWSSTG